MNTLIQKSKEGYALWRYVPLFKRAEILLTFSSLLETHREEMASLISEEIGKPLWESKTEVDSAISKGSYAIESFKARCPENIRQLPQERSTSGRSITRHKPHGTALVLGPFNFPLHLPHGHIAPALLAGNSILFKPSEYGSKIAEFYLQLWLKAGLPKEVLQVVHGDASVGRALLDLDIQALFFTGGQRGGLYLMEKFCQRPDILLALEMGGNNPLVVTDIVDLPAASYLTLLSAFLTSGQRCSSARRLIVPVGGLGDAFVKELKKMMSLIKVGLHTERPEPFMGPLISEKAASEIEEHYQLLLKKGGTPLFPMSRMGSRLLTPGLVDVTPLEAREDIEIFGPLLQLIRVKDFDEAIEEANRTKYGLVAGLFSQNGEEYEKFYHSVKAGVINWNAALTGASSLSPFGGVGFSGNFRPAGFYSADYVAYPVASIENGEMKLPFTPLPGIQGLKP